MNSNTRKEIVENDIVEVSVHEVSAAEGELAGACASATACVAATADYIGL